jgi:hypothetical protein
MHFPKGREFIVFQSKPGCFDEPKNRFFIKAEIELAMNGLQVLGLTWVKQTTRTGGLGPNNSRKTGATSREPQNPKHFSTFHRLSPVL